MSIATEIQRLQTAKANIKSAIEEKGVEVGNGTIDTYAEKIGEISVGSGGIDYDTFWDTYQDYGNRRIYYMAFQKYWNDETYNPKYPIVIDSTGNTNAFDMFMNSVGITDTKVDIDISQSKGARTMFFGCTNLVTIRKIITSATMPSYDRSFNNCPNLENITFEGVIGYNIAFPSSSKLSDTSIQNIIDRLADLTGQTTQKLTFHKTVGEKLTDTQKATITAKNWTLAY